MSELSGLELRKKALPELGWRLFFVGDGFLYHEVVPPSDPPFVLEPDQVRLWEEVPFSRISDKDLKQCPAIESDPAVSEPMFLEWILKNGHECWTIESLHTGGYRCKVDPCTERNVNTDGSTPSEARARAIVASRKEEGV